MLGTHGISAELLKLMDKAGIEQTLSNIIYNARTIPRVGLTSMFITSSKTKAKSALNSFQ